MGKTDPKTAYQDPDDIHKCTQTPRFIRFVYYILTEILQTIIQQPIIAVEWDLSHDIKINVKGGGSKGQAEAIRLALSRALCDLNDEFRPALKKEGFLTRDPRMVERKKYGRRKARRKFQFSKR